MSEYAKEYDAQSLEEAILIIERLTKDQTVKGIGQLCVNVTILGVKAKICVSF